jgi:hypothetical protein
MWELREENLFRVTSLSDREVRQLARGCRSLLLLVTCLGHRPICVWGLFFPEPLFQLCKVDCVLERTAISYHAVPCSCLSVPCSKAKTLMTIIAKQSSLVVIKGSRLDFVPAPVVLQPCRSSKYLSTCSSFCIASSIWSTRTSEVLLIWTIGRAWFRSPRGARQISFRT